MTERPYKESPIACDLTAMDAEQRVRHQTIMHELHAAIRDIEELPNGYAFRFPVTPSLCLTVAEFINLERLCCPFLNFALELECEGGPLRLRLTGREGVKQFLRAELGIPVKGDLNDEKKEHS